ncbi:hypothetical protein EWB00_000750, partial [Schistosoma japonicum]
LKNPWESFIFDQTVDTINDTSDCFNSIKLSHFPFLKSQFSSIDYLIKCEKCNVMLLPESISLHYGNRHTEPSKSVDSAILPYEAVSWCESQAEIDSKKDRTSKRTKVAPLKRSKRGIANSTDATLSSVKAGMPQALIVASREGEKSTHEELREPVLLKLAKSDGRVAPSEEVSKKPLKAPAEKKPSERSVWSVVCPRDHPSVSNFCELTTKCQLEESRQLGKDMFECRSSFNHSNDSGIGSQTHSVFHCSSYPPTPSLSPHLPSSSPSNVSDDTTLGFSQIRSDIANRPVSRSSHSSSSSGVGIFDQHSTDSTNTLPSTVFNVNSAKAVSSLPLPNIKSTPKNKLKCKFPTAYRLNNLTLGSTSQPLFLGGALTQVHPSSEVETAVYHLKSSHQEFDSKITNNELKRNGFHSWITNEQPTSADTVHKADNVRRLLTFQRLSTSRNQTVLLQQAPRQIKGIHSAPSFIPQYYQAENSRDSEAFASSDSDRFTQPNIFIRPEKSSELELINDSSSRINWPSESIISDPSAIMTKNTSELQEFSDLDDTFDPLTQCGCLEVDDIKCKNSILCTVHTIEEKRRVPRQHDLRYLMREARKNKQILRQLPNTSCYQFPWVVQTSGPSNAVIDLTDDISSNDSFCEPQGVLNYQAPRVSDHLQVLRHNTPFSAYDTQGRCSVYSNAVNSNGFIDMRYVSNKLTARLHQRNKSVIIAQPCTIDVRPQTESVLSCSSQVPSVNSNLDIHHFNPVGPETVQPGEYFNESNTPNVLMYPNRKQTSVYSSASYSNARLINEPQYLAQRHCLSSCQPAQPWSSRMSRYPVEGSTDATVSLDSLINNDELSSEERFDNPFCEINLPRKVHIPIVDETPSSTFGSTTLFPHLSLNSRKLQENHGRVVVNDMREKSITGRSRKTARTSYRSSGSTAVQGPTLTNLLHLRYQPKQQSQYHQQQQGQFQPMPGLLGGGKITSTEHISLRPTVINKTKSAASTADVFSYKIPSSSSAVFESQEKVDILNSINPQLVYSPSLLTPPCTYVGLSSNYSTSSSTFSSKLPSNHVLDYGADSSLGTLYVPNTLQTCSNTISSSISTYSLHSNSRPNNYVIQRNVQIMQPQPRTLFAHSVNCAQTSETSPNVILSSCSSSTSSSAPLSSNRYFVIRPSAIAQTPNLVVCAKRRDTFSTSNANRSSEDV